MFIDSYFDKRISNEKEKFTYNTKKLWEFANTRKPFICKDIKMTLTEVKILQNTVEYLKKQRALRNKTLENIIEENNLLNSTLIRAGLDISDYSVFADEPSNKSTEATPLPKPSDTKLANVELGLYGAGICFFGICIGIILMSCKKEIEERRLQENCNSINGESQTGKKLYTSLQIYLVKY